MLVFLYWLLDWSLLRVARYVLRGEIQTNPKSEIICLAPFFQIPHSDFRIPVSVIEGPAPPGHGKPCCAPSDPYNDTRG